MKVAIGITRAHNPFGEDYRASRLRENLTSSSYGEGLETGRESAQEPRQSFTRQVDFKLAKGEVGLDHYELTKYRGWYQHITLSIIALAFIKAVQWQMGKRMYRRQCLRSGSSWNLFYQESPGIPKT